MPKRPFRSSTWRPCSRATQPHGPVSRARSRGPAGAHGFFYAAGHGVTAGAPGRAGGARAAVLRPSDGPGRIAMSRGGRAARLTGSARRRADLGRRAARKASTPRTEVAAGDPRPLPMRAEPLARGLQNKGRSARLYGRCDPGGRRADGGCLAEPRPAGALFRGPTPAADGAVPSSTIRPGGAGEWVGEHTDYGLLPCSPRTASAGCGQSARGLDRRADRKRWSAASATCWSSGRRR